MKKGGLFENIKERLKGMVEERNIGDRVVLITFGDERDTGAVLDIPISTDKDKDIEYIQGVIDRLEADSPWTWMSKAFEVTKERAKEIKNESPDRRLMIYMLTDCINDPPPHINEPPRRFDEILLQYFEGFEAIDTYIYLISYRPLRPEEKEVINEKTDVVIVEPQRPIFPRIVLTISGFDFGKIDLSKGEVIRSGEISIQNIQGIEPGEKIQLIPPTGFKVSPETIVCNEKGQKETVSITIPSDIEVGEHTEMVKVRCEKAPVEPPEFKFSFFVPEDGLIGKLLKAIFPLLIFALLYILYDAFVKSKTIWAEKVGEGMIEEIELKGWKKIYLGERIADKYITFGLPKHYLQRAKLKGSVFLIEENGEKREVVFGEDVRCKDTDGNDVTLWFYKEEPIEKGQEEMEEETKGPSPWDRIEGKDE